MLTQRISNLNYYFIKFFKTHPCSSGSIRTFFDDVDESGEAGDVLRFLPTPVDRKIIDKSFREIRKPDLFEIPPAL